MKLIPQLVILGSVAWAACTGTIGSNGPASGSAAGENGGGGDDTGAGAGSGRGAGSGNPGSGDEGPRLAECPAPGKPVVGAAPLRRLTIAEYNNTIADLLGDKSNPATAFPPDARVDGFDNNVSVQTVTFSLADDYFKAAETLATRAVTDLGKLVSCAPAQRGEETCATEFIKTFGQRAFRRPLSAAENTSQLETYRRGRTTGDYNNGIRLVIARMLGSPHFLYRPEFGVANGATADGVVAFTSWEMASRLSYLLWATMPDATLFAAAAADKLRTPDEISAQVDRMSQDSRTRAAMQSFYSGWLGLHAVAKVGKNETMYPGFSSVLPSMVQEITTMLDDVTWNGDGAVEGLFRADYTFMNRLLGTFLGIEGAASLGTAFTKIPLDPGGNPGPARRAGILATAGLLAGESKPEETSPILRGRFIAQQFLCLAIPLAPPGIPPLPGADASNLTTRERFEQHEESACASCHILMDPLGFAFENFDTVGRYRETEKGKTIDASGELEGTDVDGPFADSVEFSAKLAGSEQVKNCIVRQWMRFALGRTEGEQDERALAQLSCGFTGEAARLRDLPMALANSDAFMWKTTATGGQP